MKLKIKNENDKESHHVKYLLLKMKFLRMNIEQVQALKVGLHY